MTRLSILFISFLFSACILQAQELWLKKVTTQYNPNSEAVEYYNYDENMHLLSIYTENTFGDTVIRKFYENDRLILEIQPGLVMKFEYEEDSVLEYREQSNGSFLLNMIFLLDANHQCTAAVYMDSNGNPVGTSTYTWSAGNCVSALLAGGNQESCTYDPELKNPCYNQNKFFRRSFSGSVNQLIHGEFGSVNYDITIISSESGYPSEILFQPSNGDAQTIFFEYHQPSGAGDGIPEPGYDVLRIECYNLLGQKITEPFHGFYIEKKFTSKGVISTKCYTGRR